jgi:hypothetical protein
MVLSDVVYIIAIAGHIEQTKRSEIITKWRKKLASHGKGRLEFFKGTGQLGGQVKERTRCKRADRCIFTLSNTRKRPLSDDVGIDVGSGRGKGGVEYY